MLPPKSSNEAERLAALRRYGILDTPAEAAFDNITRLAASICNTPIAIINFIDETRQWFKSEVGLGVKETPLDTSICGYAILTPGLTVIADLTADQRFAGNPLVADGPQWRFYAGAPLQTDDGYALGTLCVLDVMPRNLSDVQKDALEVLAKQVVAQLELRRQLAQSEQTAADLRLAQNELRQRDDQLELITNMVPALVSYIDTDARYRLNNRSYQTWFGKPSAFFTGKTVEETLGAKAWEAIRPHLQTALTGRQVTYESELPYEGGTRWINATYTPHYGAEGRVRGVVEMVHDITEQKRAERALQESERRYRVLTEVSPQTVWMTDAEGRVNYCNQWWLDFTGLSMAESAFSGWTVAVHPEHRQRLGEAWQLALSVGGQFEAELPIRRAADGQYRWHLTRGQPLRDDAGEIVNWIGIAIDIDDRRRAEEALLEADRRKDHFLATLAHELRNPLAPISNALALWPMVQSDLAQMDKLHAMMGRQLQQMTRLIDDLLDVSRITRGKIALRRSRTDIGTVIDSAVEAVRPFIERQRHALNVVLPEHPPAIEADVARLLQVFGNVLNNAAKYTPPGGIISISAEREGDTIAVRVRDNGPGIPSDMLTKIFGMFVQVDSSLERSHGGLGIGLTLVKNLVELHGGSVEARSDGMGRGAEFIIRLPIAVGYVEQLPGERPPQYSLRKVTAQARRRMLVMEEHVAASVTTLGMVLQSMGHDVRLAHDGPAAIASAREYRPEVIFLDIAMPGMSGYEVARHLRADDTLAGVRLVALTGFGQEEDGRLAIGAGFDHHLVKPANVDLIETVLAGLPATAETPAARV